jgi:ATP-dependent Clp protease ATP-binding subunit ClpX
MAVAVRSKTLDLYLSTEAVIGQEKARRQLAVLLDRQWQVHEGRFERAHGAILSGASGSGKTMTARMMCEHLGLPFAETDATRYTESGYKGLDLQQMFIPLLEAAAKMKDAEHPLEASRFRHSDTSEPVIRFSGGGGLHLDQRQGGPNREASVLKREDIDDIIERAQTGVILLDEFDKWMLRINHVTGEKDKAIQSELLKMIEGSQEYVTDSDEEMGVPFDTTKVLIICAGAFVNLFRQIRKRMGGDADDNTVTLSDNFWNQIVPEDFEKFGLLPELAGRLSTHIFTRPLQKEHLLVILRGADSPLQHYRQQFEDYGCVWAVSEAGLIWLAGEAIRRLIGARALEFVFWKFFSDALYSASVAEGEVKVVLEPMMERAEVQPR